MAEDNTWVMFPMFCNNCSSKVIGLKNHKGEIKYHCSSCGCSLVRKDRSRRHTTIELFAPEGAEALALVPIEVLNKLH